MRYTKKRFVTFLTWLCFVAVSTNAQLPDGFAVWSEGDAHNRTIMMRTLRSDGIMEQPVKVVQKGDRGGDIQSQISFDGKWLAFTRSRGGTRDSYGGDDYHEFEKWDLYIVRLDGSFPAQPQQIARGYWPSWGDDSYNESKTLYYCTHHDSKTIRKVTINESGMVAGSDVKVQDIPGSVAGQNFVGFAMMAPNGKFMAWRGDDVCLYFFEDWMGKEAGTGYVSARGCMPSITADSRWVLNAYHKVTRVGKSGTDCKKSGDYHFGTSPDLNWFVNRVEGGAQVQNKGYPVFIFPVKINAEEAVKYLDSENDLDSRDYEPYGNGIPLTQKGSWPDVHTYTEIPPDTVLNLSASTKNILVNETVELTASVKNEKGEPVNQLIEWTVNGGGSLSSTTGTASVFTSDGTGGEFIVTVSSGVDTRSVTITVIDPSTVVIEGLPAGYIPCSAEGENCTFEGVKNVAYGAEGQFEIRENVQGSIECSNDAFGDPLSGVEKACYVQVVTTGVLKPAGKESTIKSIRFSEVAGKLTISDVPDAAYLTVHNYQGKLMRKEKLSGDAHTLNIKTFPSGVYVISIGGNRGIVSRKMFKK